MCSRIQSMFDLQRGQDGDVLHMTTRHMKAAQAKWYRLTATDLFGITTKSQLTDRVEERYSLPHEQAAEDVEIWASDKRL
jgi:hypothetical protein